LSEPRQGPVVKALTELAALGASDGEIFGELTELERAALGSSWELWARPNQAIPPTVELTEPPPEGKRWPLWGRTRPGKPWHIGAFISGRGTGKTSPIAQHVHRMATTMEWPRFICCAQTMEKAVEIFVDAANGLVHGVPPWERPTKTAGPGGEGLRLRYPSGAEAVITSASGVDTRGPEFHGAWCTEVAYWPRNRAVTAWNTILDATRAGEGQVLIDSTPSAGDPILSQIKDHAELYDNVWWIRHAAGDNALHVREGYEADMRRRYAGTAEEQEEVDGLESEERGMVKRRHIERARRNLPSQWLRRIVILDPAYTSPFPGKRPDVAGVVSMSEGVDHQLYLTDDKSGVQAIEAWAAAAVELYIDNRCDCMVIETNRGGQMSTSMVRAMAEKRGFGNVVVVANDAKTRHVPGTINVKEVFAEHDKWTRGELLRDLYKGGMVSHVHGADTGEVEKTLTGWYPQKRGERSPGDLDAVAWGCRELAGHLQKPAQEGQRQLNEAARQQHQQATEQARRPVGYLRQPTGRGRERDTRSRI
jgi:phage terminase large subunit-like protein